jgi:Protein of unknown function (DUF1761)
MEFVYPHVGLVPLLVAAVAQFVLGFVWYSGMTPVGKRWMAEMGFADTGGQPGAEMAIFPVSSILAAWAVSMVIGWSGAHGAWPGVLAAWVVAMAVGAQVLASGVASGKSSMALTAINVGYLVVGYAIMGAIIGTLA